MGPELQAALAALDAPIRGPADLEAFDLATLRAVPVGPDRQALARALLGRLQGAEDDPRLVDALLEVGSARDIRALEDVALAHVSVAAARAARRLAVIQQHRGMIRRLQALVQQGWSFVIAEAVAGLAECRDPAAERALQDVLPQLEGYERRAPVVEALLQRHGLSAWQFVASPVWSLRLGLLSGSLAVRRDAERQLGLWLDRLRQGDTPAALGVVVPDVDPSPAAWAVYGALRDRQATIDLAALDSLQGHERDWMVDVACGALEDRDPRAGEVLRRLDTPRARLMLQG